MHTNAVNRILRATAVELAMVARGTLVGHINRQAKIHDIAAGVHIARVAGAIVLNPADTTNTDFAPANYGMQDLLVVQGEGAAERILAALAERAPRA